MPLPASAFPLRTSGSRILGADGSVVRLAGVNWGGAYLDHGVADGLAVRPRSEIIGWIVRHGFNSVRFPFSLGAFATTAGNPVTSPADPALLAANPDLAGLSRYQAYCTLVEAMTGAGLYVVLNQHVLFPGSCCADTDYQGLWYNDNWPAAVFRSVWLTLARRFAGNPLVGFDLHNEPRRAQVGGAWRNPSWGTGWAGPYPTDFHDMYQNTANLIRDAVTAAGSPVRHLVFCEGLSYAGDLTGWAAHPVTGGNIVASVHDYPWFHKNADGTQQSWADYKAQNDRRWGYLAAQGTVPVWVGEAGQNTGLGRAAFGSGWLPNWLRYMQELGDAGHWCWWALQATENQGTVPGGSTLWARDGQGEGFGLMSGQDWMGTQADALAMLAPVMP